MSYNLPGGVFIENENTTIGVPTVSVGTGSKFYMKGTETNSGTRTVSGTETNSATNTVSGTNTLSGTFSLTGTLTKSTAGKIRESVQSLTTASTAAVAPTGLTVLKATAAAKTYVLSTATFLTGMRKQFFCTVGATSRACNVKCGTPSSGSALTFDGTNYVLSFRQANTHAEIIRCSSNRIAVLSRSTGASTGVVMTVTGAS